MMVLKDILISEIAVEERLRPVDPERCKALAFTIERHGLINPVTVRSVPAKKDANFILIAGAHRLDACKSLGHSHIQAIVVKADGGEAQMLEIAENFFHTGLSVIERAAFGERFRELWEENVGPISSRKDRGSRPNLAATFEGRFEDAVARSLGVSPSAAKRLHRIATKLHPHLRDALRGTVHASNESLLLKLAKLAMDEQARVAAAFSEHPDLTAAQKLVRPDKGRMDETQRREELMMNTWRIMSEAQRDAFLESVGAARKPIPEGFDSLPKQVMRVTLRKGLQSPLWDFCQLPEEQRLVQVPFEETLMASRIEALREEGGLEACIPRMAPPRGSYEGIHRPTAKRLAKLDAARDAKSKRKLDNFAPRLYWAIQTAGVSKNAEIIHLCFQMDAERQEAMLSELWPGRTHLAIHVAAGNLVQKQREAYRQQRKAKSDERNKMARQPLLKAGPFKGLLPALAERLGEPNSKDKDLLEVMRLLDRNQQMEAAMRVQVGERLDDVFDWACEQVKTES